MKRIIDGIRDTHGRDSEGFGPGRVRHIYEGVQKGGGTEVVRIAYTFALLFALLGASVASAETPRCGGSLALWTGTSTYTGGNQGVMVGSRAEGGCNAPAGFRIGVRADFYPLPGKTIDFTSPKVEDLASVEVWGVVSRKVAGPLSAAVFGGVQKSLEGGQLGIGASTNSLCAGGRLDGGGSFAVAGLCSRYAPVQRAEPRRDGPALVGTLVMPIKANVKLAANGALMRGDYLLVFGPAVTWGK